MRLCPDRMIDIYFGTGIFISALWFLSHSAVLPIARISFEERAVVRDQSIYLKDIARIHCSVPFIQKQLDDFKIGASAIPGKTRQFLSEDIAVRLRASYQDGVCLSFENQGAILVETKAHIISGMEIQEHVRKYIMEQMPWQPEDVLMTFSNCPQTIELLGKDFSIKIKPEHDVQYIGGERFFFQVFLGNTMVRNVPVPVDFRVFQNVCIASKKIKRHEEITAEMITLDKQEITRCKERLFFSPESLLGKRARRTISNGRCITLRMLEDIPMVTAGEPVNIICRRGTICVSVPGIAREQGAVGDEISVQNTESRKMIKGVVLKDRSILVADFSGGKL